jgi:hypothetical protein
MSRLYDHYRTAKTFTWEKYAYNYRRIHPFYNCLMCVYMFEDENDKRRHLEEKHHRCGYCYGEGTEEHLRNEHPEICMRCHEQGIYAPTVFAEQELQHLLRYHPHHPKITV